MPKPLRALLCAIAAILILSLLALASSADRVTYTLPEAKSTPPAVSAESMLLLEGRGGLVLAEKNADTPMPMASTTKIMTALVALEHLPLERVLTVPPEAVGIEGSSIYLFAGEQITVETLLYALLLSSANDAAVALALASAGSVEGFAALMNEKAAALGLKNTHFCNPHGLHDEDHYTTARELALLSAAAMQNEVFRRIVQEKRYTAPQNATGATRLFLNHNRLLRTVEGAVGIKTGFTKAAGRCLVSAAERDGLLLIAVTLRAPNDWQDHRALYDWAFAAYEQFSPPAPSLHIPVVGGAQQSVALTPTAALSLTLARPHGEITCTVEAPRFLFGGFEDGEVKGRVIYRLEGEVLGEIPLATAQSVAAEPPLGFFAALRQKFKNRK